jgi:hypothetical protein
MVCGSEVADPKGSQKKSNITINVEAASQTTFIPDHP